MAGTAPSHECSHCSPWRPGLWSVRRSVRPGAAAAFWPSRTRPPARLRSGRRHDREPGHRHAHVGHRAGHARPGREHAQADGAAVRGGRDRPGDARRRARSPHPGSRPDGGVRSSREWPSRACCTPGRPRRGPRRRGRGAVADAGLGAVTGVLGVGGGFLAVPAPVGVLGTRMRHAVDTSLPAPTVNSPTAPTTRAERSRGWTGRSSGRSSGPRSPAPGTGRLSAKVSGPILQRIFAPVAGRGRVHADRRGRVRRPPRVITPGTGTTSPGGRASAGRPRRSCGRTRCRSCTAACRSR